MFNAHKVLYGYVECENVVMYTMAIFRNSLSRSFVRSGKEEKKMKDKKI